MNGYKNFETQYRELLSDIIINGWSNEGQGVRTVWEDDGVPAYTKSVWARQLRIDLTKEFPLLTGKFVNTKSFSSEIQWILVEASNVVAKARELGTNVWNEWENEDGDIGSAYGYQVRNNTYRVYVDKISKKSLTAMGKTIDGEKGENNYYSYHDEKDEFYVELMQLDYVIHQLIDNPASRQTILTLWNPKETHEMELPPCVFQSDWEIRDGKVCVAITVRSSDVFLGLPFNVAQYSLIANQIAQVTGYGLGEMVFTLNNAHLYDRHIPLALEYLQRETHQTPQFWIDKSVKAINRFKYDINFGWYGYGKHKGHAGTLPAPLAISPREYERKKRK